GRRHRRRWRARRRLAGPARARRRRRPRRRRRTRARARSLTGRSRARARRNRRSPPGASCRRDRSRSSAGQPPWSSFRTVPNGGRSTGPRPFDSRILRAGPPPVMGSRNGGAGSAESQYLVAVPMQVPAEGTAMAANDLESIARQLSAEGKGILAADESFGTIEKRFKAIDLPNTEENRRAYRDMLFTTPGFSDFISGVILFDETIRQKSDDGTPFPELLKKAGSIPGIKVDAGAKPMAGFPNEVVTEGLDGLRDRLAEYSKLGAQFTKWRAVITIDE